MHPLARLAELFETRGALVAGVLSGTSADGIDVALCRMRTRGGVLERPELCAFQTFAFPADQARALRAVLDGEVCLLRESALLSRDLGRSFGAAARALAEREGLALDLVGSHGQTVYHHDGREESGPASLQLGEGDHVAEAAGCACVSDFRQRDLAAGGEGAPLSALADGLVFAHLARPLALLNLGGMGNLTLLEEDGGVLAFDTGPAGSLLDGLARALLGRDFDPSGETAARGVADPQRVRRWLEHPFFERPPPRSTGRDTFGAEWVRACLAEGGRAEDLLATAVEFVATTVAQGLERFARSRPRELVVAGGGVHHLPLLGRIGALSGLPVASSAERGVDPDAREGLVFAVLAARAVLGTPSTLRSATRAAPGRVLGKISLPSVADATTGGR
ncbi:MAG: anhydro-N-acetylmuramic acid kinase [Planctomycetes bacterium]|nr:anhydro-N-acetylmuramic acid kinase [Planctomycetota bacterium]